MYCVCELEEKRIQCIHFPTYIPNWKLGYYTNGLYKPVSRQIAFTHVTNPCNSIFNTFFSASRL